MGQWACYQKTGSPAWRRWSPSRLNPLRACGSVLRRPGWSRRCWPGRRPSIGTKALSEPANGCTRFTGLGPSIRRRLSRRAAALPARRTRLAAVPRGSSASAAAWPTTWAWARPCRCWRCSSARRVETARRGRRWWSLPRSLVFNWISEAAPVHAGAAGARLHRDADRHAATDDLRRRRGADHLRHAAARRRAPSVARFDYVDSRRSAGDQEREQHRQSVRLLHADHRLAMTGTPIENHLGELWSLFEFLNPGMIGSGGRSRSPRGSSGRRAHVGSSRAAAAVHSAADEDTSAPELPETGADAVLRVGYERAPLYNELRDHYRCVYLDR